MQDNERQERQTFKKQERLCSRTKIKSLFEKANTINAYPIRLLWKKDDGTSASPLQVLVSVPKRNIRKATLRNKIRRRIKEAFRRNKQTILPGLSQQGTKLIAIFIFTGKEEIPFREAEVKIIQLLNRLKSEYEKTKW
jgi:ribonuclease P protein component